MAEIVGRAGDGTARKIEPEAEFGQHRDLEAHHQRRRERRLVEMGDHHGERLVQAGMGIALRQQPKQRRDRAEAIERNRRRDQPRSVGGEQLDLVFAEMLVEPRPPGQRDGVAGLEHWLLLGRAPAADEAEMAAMVAGHHLQDHGALAMAPDADDRALVAPFHGMGLGQDIAGRNSAGSSWSGSTRPSREPEPAGHEILGSSLRFARE